MITESTCPTCGQNVKISTSHEGTGCYLPAEKSIKTGEIFNVEGKRYIVGMPTKPDQETNEHGQIMLALFEIND